MRLWDVAGQASLGEQLIGYQVNSLAFSPDGKLIVLGSEEATLDLLDVVRQVPLGKPMRGHRDSVQSVSFSPDGKLIVSGSKDTTLRLWDVTQQAPLGKPLEGHTGVVTSVAFSPDGRLIASASGDKTVRLWNVATQAPLGKPMTGHKGEVQSVSFSPDGKLIVSGSESHTVRLWKTATGCCLTVLYWHYSITTVAMTPSPCLTLLDAKKAQPMPMLSKMEIDEDMLAIGDEMGALSFWAVSRKDASIRFVGMPRHASMPLLLDGIALRGCRMDQQSKRLLAQYRAKVDEVVVEVAEEKEKKSVVNPTSFPILSGLSSTSQPSSTSSTESIISPQPSTLFTPTSLTQTVLISAASSSSHISSAAFFSAASSPIITSNQTKIKPPQLDEKKREQLIPLYNELTKACEDGSLARVKAAIEKGAVVYPLNKIDKSPLYCAVYGMNPEIVQYLIEQRGEEVPAISWRDCEAHNQMLYGRTFLNMNFDPSTYGDWHDLLIQIESNEYLTGHHLVQVKKFLGGNLKNYASFKALKNAVAQWKIKIVGLGQVMREREYVEDAWGQTESVYKAGRNQIRQAVEIREMKSKQYRPTSKTTQTLSTTMAASTVSTATNSVSSPSLLLPITLDSHINSDQFVTSHAPLSQTSLSTISLLQPKGHIQGDMPRSPAFFIPEERKSSSLTALNGGLFSSTTPKASITSSTTGKKLPPTPSQQARLFPLPPEQKTQAVTSVSTKNTLEYDLAKRFSQTNSSASSSSSSSSSTLFSSTSSSRSASTSSTTSTTTLH